MTTQLSFSKIEKQILPGYRNKISVVESGEEVKKVFITTIQELFRQVYQDSFELDYEDLTFLPDRDPGYLFSKNVLENQQFLAVWQKSDLPNLINRLSSTAVKHYIHLRKHPEKTELKIYCEVIIHPDKVPGVPRFLMKRIMPIVEKMIKEMLQPNLTSLGRGLTSYFKAQEQS